MGTATGVAANDGPQEGLEHQRGYFRHQKRRTRIDGFEPTGFTPQRRDHLSQLEGSEHFWFEARRRLISRLVDRFAPTAAAALDLGCGGGAPLTAVHRHGRRAVGVDAYTSSLAAARQRLNGAELVQADVLRLPIADRSFDLLLALDVIEHVEDHRLLAEAARVASADAVLLLSAPALSCLWSRLDVLAGHRRRYTYRDLEPLLTSSGWRPVHHTHYQLLLLPLVWAARRSGWRSAQTVERRPPRLLAACLGAVNRLEVALFGGMPLPWGSSVVVVARRSS